MLMDLPTSSVIRKPPYKKICHRTEESGLLRFDESKDSLRRDPLGWVLGPTMYMRDNVRLVGIAD